MTPLEYAHYWRRHAAAIAARHGNPGNPLAGRMPTCGDTLRVRPNARGKTRKPYARRRGKELQDVG